MDNVSIGKRIEQARELRKLSMEDLASRIGVAKSTIQRYEKGKISKIKIPVIESIARELNVNPSWIIGKTDRMNVEKMDELDRIISYVIETNKLSSDKKELIELIIELPESQSNLTLKLTKILHAYMEGLEEVE